MRRATTTRELDPRYDPAVDDIGEQEWHEELLRFDDANIYQTWPYGAITYGEGRTSRLILRSGTEVVAMAQARIARLPVVNLGLAYVLWGPLWRRSGEAGSLAVFRQALRAMRNEYVCKRGLTLRLAPRLIDGDPCDFRSILEEEGFTASGPQSSSRTILMDLRPPVEALREGMRPHWRRELKQAERRQLNIEEGAGEDLFRTFIDMYHEMVSRKRFVEPNDINRFRLIQKRLPDSLKMMVLVCRSDGEARAGAIASAMGDTALYLFGATSNTGLKSQGSYALQWKLIEQLKRAGIRWYDLNGVNPDRNPGTYKFKSDLAGINGREVCYLGRFESHAGRASALCVRGADLLRSHCRSLKERFRTARSAKFRLNPAS